MNLIVTKHHCHTQRIYLRIRFYNTTVWWKAVEAQGCADWLLVMAAKVQGFSTAVSKNWPPDGHLV